MLVHELIKECSENIDDKELHQNKMIYDSTLNDSEKNVVAAQYT